MANLSKTMSALSPLAILQNPESIKNNPLSPAGMLWGALDKDKKKADAMKPKPPEAPTPKKPIGYY